jgi:hypothetical protein
VAEPQWCSVCGLVVYPACCPREERHRGVSAWPGLQCGVQQSVQSAAGTCVEARAACCWLLAAGCRLACRPFAAHVPALLRANSSISPFSFFPCRTKIKIRLETAYGEWVERIPAWIKWATQVSVGTGVENCAVCMCCLGLTI